MEAGDGTVALGFPDVPKLQLDQLIDQLVDRAQDVKRVQGRLRALLHGIETVTSDLALDAVLRNIVEAACDLTSARYGALGVIAPTGGLEQFIHVGMPDDVAERIGHLPEGKGLLGALISDPRPIRLRHMTDDPRSTGFPDGHPPMDSFLGVPVRVLGEVFGNLYLADSAHGEFTLEDEELVNALAAAAGTAISNARLYQSAQVQQRWLEASAEIGSHLLAQSGEDPLQTIARRAIDIAGADLVSLGVITDDRAGLVIEAAFGDGREALLGRRFALSETLAGAAAALGTPLRMVDAGESGGGVPSHLSSVMDAGPLMVIPLAGTGDVRGVLTLVRTRGRLPFTDGDLAMASGFASHASVALELADSRAAEQRLVILEDRDRIAMDLHDHVIQDLFAVGLGLESMANLVGSGDRLYARLISRVEDIDKVIRRIRASIFELRGALGPSTGGLRGQVLEITSELTPTLGFAPHVAFTGLVDLVIDEVLMDDVTACLRESLTNVAKHAHATSVVVDVLADGEELTLTVTDNGVGPDGATRSSGTANLRARAEKHHGSFVVARGETGGTTVTWKVATT